MVFERNGSTSAAVQVILNNGDGTFGAPSMDANIPDQPGGVGFGSISYSGSVAVGHFIGGPALDVVASHNAEDGTLHIFEGNGDGTFQPDAPRTTGAGAVMIRVADLNGDGVDDMALHGGETTSILTSTASGVWAESTMFTPGRFTADLQLGDLDGGNGADLIIGRGGETAKIYQNDGAGNINTTTPLNTNINDARSLGVGDYDGDGRNDVLSGDPFGGIRFPKGDGVGGFGPPAPEAIRTSGPGTNSAPNRGQDLTGDGRPEVVLATDQVVNIIHVGTDGTVTHDMFTHGSRDDTANGNAHSTGAVAVAEVTGDGRLDLVATSWRNQRDGEVTVLAGDTRFAPGRYLAPQNSVASRTVSSHTETRATTRWPTWMTTASSTCSPSAPAASSSSARATATGRSRPTRTQARSPAHVDKVPRSPRPTSTSTRFKT